MKKLMTIALGLALIASISSCKKCKNCECDMTETTVVTQSFSDGTPTTATTTVADPESLDLSNFCKGDEYITQQGQIVTDPDGEYTWTAETFNTQVVFGVTVTTTTVTTTTMTCTCS